MTLDGARLKFQDMQETVPQTPGAEKERLGSNFETLNGLL